MNWLAKLLPLTHDLSDEQNMLAVQRDGDHAAFARLVRRWETPIRGLCTRMTGDEYLGEDLAQESFARVFTRRHQFLPDRKFSTWLWRIAINLCHENARRSSGRRVLPLKDQCADGATPHLRLVAQEESDRVRDAVAMLPESLRVVVVLREYQGLKFREIAEVLETPEGTIKSRMADALQQLRERFSSEIESEDAVKVRSLL